MATLDLITLTEAKQEIAAVNVDVDDLLLAGYISAVSQMIDNRCGPVVARTIADETHEVEQTSSIRLRVYPVLSVTTVDEFTREGTQTTLTLDTLASKHANGCYLVPRKWGRTLERRNAGAAYVFPPFGAVRVTYVAGRCASTAAVPEIFKHAARLAVATNWSIQQGSGSNTFGMGDGGFGAPLPIVMPRAVEAMLAAEFLPQGVA